LKSFSINIIFLMLSLIGLVLFKELKISLNPVSTNQKINIYYQFSGASAQTIEHEITHKIEQAANRLSGLKEISSVSSNSYGIVTCTFDSHASLEYVRLELSSEIRRLYASFPIGASYPEISTFDVSSKKNKEAFMVFSVFSSKNPNTIYQFVKERIEPHLSQLDGISKVEVSGASVEYIKISFNQQKISNFNISVSDINKAIGLHFEKKHLGQIEFQNQIYYVVLNQSINDTIRWKNIAITKKENRIIYLSDLAKISIENELPKSYFRINGKSAINIAIYANTEVNELELAKKIYSKINTIKSTLPLSYKIKNIYDASLFIKKELKNLIIRSIATLLLLLIFVIFIRFSFRYLLIIILGFIANLLIAILFYVIFKIHIHLNSLAGITISLGLIIDNSIIMLEHYQYQRNKNVFLVLFAATLTTIAALSSIAFLSEEIQNYFIDFALIIIVNLSVSLFIALFFIPALIEKLNFFKKVKVLKVKTLKRIILFNLYYTKILFFMHKRRKIILVALILVFGIPIYLFPSKLESNKKIAQIYNYTLGSVFYKEHIKEKIEKILGGTSRLFYYYVFENEVTTRNEQTVLYLSLSSSKNHSLQQINDVFKILENYLIQYKEIKSFHTQILNNESTLISIYFKPQYENSTFPNQLKNRLTFFANGMNAFNWNIWGVGLGYSSFQSDELLAYAIALYGYNYEQTQQHINIIKQELKKIARIKKIKVVSSRNRFRTLKPEILHLTFDNSILNLYQTNSLEVYEKLKTLSPNQYAKGYLFENEIFYYYTLEEENAQKFSHWQFQNHSLNAFAKIQNHSFTQNSLKSDLDIIRQNNEYKRIIEFEYLGTKKFADKYLSQAIKQINKNLPTGNRVEIEKRNFFSAKELDFQNYGIIFIVIILIFVLSAILLESLSQAIIVVSIIPLSFTGLFISFYLSGVGFDQGGFAAFLLLSGITVNSVLYIINQFNINTKKFPYKMHLTNYLKAFNQKIIPILLTSFSTVLGLIPFVIFSESIFFWRALAVGSMGGMVSSFLVILFILPLFFNFYKK